MEGRMGRVGKGRGRKRREGRGNKHTRFKTCGAAHASAKVGFALVGLRVRRITQKVLNESFGGVDL